MDEFAEPQVDARQAFDELGQLVLSEQSMESVLQKVADLARRVVPGAEAVSVSLVRDGRAETAVYAGQAALDLDERQYERGYGPCLDAVRAGEVMVIEDMAKETRWEDFTDLAASRGWGSSVSVPIPMQQVGAGLNVYGRQAHAFDGDARQLAATFASYAAVALANMHLYDSTRRLAENLQIAMESRAVIEQAKGILMRDRSCSASEAFEVLVSLSQTSNRKLRDVAQAVADSTRT